MEPQRIIYRRQNVRVAEIAGGVTGNCAMLWCCIPYTVVNMLSLIVYKVPTKLCQKAIKRYHKSRLVKAPTKKTMTWSANRFESDIVELRPNCITVVPEGTDVKLVVVGESEMDAELRELEKEMFKRFYDNGFWRGSSQRNIM